MITVGLSSDVRMVCVEGKMNVTFIKYDVINDSVIYENVSTIDLDLLTEKLNKSGINVGPVNFTRGADYLEINYTPLYNYGPYNYVKTAISNKQLTLRFRIYYDGTAQICAISDKLFKDGYLSKGYITDALLLSPLMKCSTTTDSDGPWPYSYSGCSVGNQDTNNVYLQWILKEAVDYINFHLYDVFQKEYQDYKNNLLNITDNYIYSYKISIDPINSYITGFGDEYLETISTVGKMIWSPSGSMNFNCNSQKSYIVRLIGGWSDATYAFNYHTIYMNNYYVYGPVDKNQDTNMNTKTIFVPANNNFKDQQSFKLYDLNCFYYVSFLVKSSNNYVLCNGYKTGNAYIIVTRQKKFASGYGTGRAVKELSTSISTPGRPINVTVYIDPPRASYVKITDYVPKDFGWNKTITIERRKLGNEIPIQTQTLTVNPISKGDEWIYTLNGQTLNILQNLSNEEYIEIKYQLITPTTNVQSQYNIKGVDVVYAPKL